MGESFEALLSILTAGRNTLMQRRLGATVDQVDTDGGGRQSAEVMVSYSDKTWTVTDENKTWSFTPTSGGRIEYSTGEVEQRPRSRDDYLPPEIALFFPLFMRIWAESRTTSGWLELKWKAKESDLPWSLLKIPASPALRSLTPGTVS